MNTRKIVLASLAAALIAGVAAPSFAGPGRDGPGRHAGRTGAMQELMFVRLLKTADADKDAKITREELAQRQNALFAEIDADKDGNLIPGELRTYRKAKMEEFRKARTEQREERRQETAENGQDGDRSDRGERRADRDGRGDGERRGMHHGRKLGHMGGFHLVRLADTDENGQFSKAEITAAADKLFARMDRNGDGVISIDDMPNRPF